MAAQNELRSLIATDDMPRLLSEAQDLWHDLSNLKPKFDTEISASLTREHVVWRDSFLRKYLILDATIPGIGPGRKSTLVSHGIETAADVSHSRLKSIDGFGVVLVSSLISWKQALLNGYMVPTDSELINKQLQPQLKNYVMTKRRYSDDLHAAYDKLRRADKEYKHRRKSLENKIIDVHQKHMISQSDLNELLQPASKIYSGMYPYLVF